jgi:hypothetical protein
MAMVANSAPAAEVQATMSAATPISAESAGASTL